MTDDSHHPPTRRTVPKDHQQAVEACQHVVDALHGGDLSRAWARSLLDEARAAVERAQHDESEQAYRADGNQVVR